MERLLSSLRELEASTLPDIPRDEDVYLTPQDSPLVPIIESLATDLFLYQGYRPRFDKIDAFLRDHGYLIFPELQGLRRSAACLQTKKGIIVFG